MDGKRLKLDSSCEDNHALSASDSFEVKTEMKRKKACAKVLEVKDMEQKLLENQLNETKQENVTAKLQVLKAREDIVSNFAEFIEMRFQCAMCNVQIIKATSLNCAHVICKLCISQWMKIHKDCPICRCPITSPLQAVALNDYIDKMMEPLKDERKQRRAEEEQRKAEQVKFDAEDAGSSCHIAATTDGAGSSPQSKKRRALERTFTVGSNTYRINGPIIFHSRDIIRGEEAEFLLQAATTSQSIEISDESSASLTDTHVDSTSSDDSDSSESDSDESSASLTETHVDSTSSDGGDSSESDPED